MNCRPEDMLLYAVTDRAWLKGETLENRFLTTNASEISCAVIESGSFEVWIIPIFTRACLVYFPTGTLPPASAMLSAS